MDQKPAFDVRLANAGLFAGVGLAWLLLLAGESLDSEWLLSGFLAVGLGGLLIALFRPLGERIFSRPGAESKVETSEERLDPAEDDALRPEPRLRVLIVSSFLEAAALAMLAWYFSGSFAVALSLGALTGAAAMAVSAVLARKLQAPPDGVGGSAKLPS